MKRFNRLKELTVLYVEDEIDVMEEIVDILESVDIESMKGVEICGVMGMATFTDNMEKVRSEFNRNGDCYLLFNTFHNIIIQ